MTYNDSQTLAPGDTVIWTLNGNPSYWVVVEVNPAYTSYVFSLRCVYDQEGRWIGGPVWNVIDTTDLVLYAKAQS